MSFFVRLSMLAAVSALLASCQNQGQKASLNDPYVANFGNDGAYRPYPGQPGTMQSGGGGGHTATPTYTPPPTPPPVQSDPYAFSGPSTAPSKPASVASHTTTTRPKSSSSSGSSKPKTTAKTTAKKKSSGSYKVVPGDTLYGIARKRGSSVAKIKAANNLTSDLIRPGQALKIP